MSAATEDTTQELIRATLELSVPLWIEHLKREPWKSIDERRDTLVSMIAAHGDDILYRSRKKGDTANAFNALAETVAILSFAPGGVTAFGLHFEAEHPNHVKTGRK